MTAGKAENLRLRDGDGAGRDSLRQRGRGTQPLHRGEPWLNRSEFSARSPPAKRDELRDRFDGVSLDALRARALPRRAVSSTRWRSRARVSSSRSRKLRLPRARSAPRADAATLARGYAGVADALSVLCDAASSAARSTISPPPGNEFEGPILAKDFFIDRRQVVEARIAGADAVSSCCPCWTTTRRAP